MDFASDPIALNSIPLLTPPASAAWNAVDDCDDESSHVLKKDDRSVRRRSSKACDQCRKSKCKCERTGDDGPCKNCQLLGTPCTSLGPSRKRGPPKGYLDAVEARLRQMEALLGTLITADDPRVRSVLKDLAADPLARDILRRVDESPFGTHPNHPDTPEDRAARILRTTTSTSVSAPRFLPFAHPSTEWQDHLRRLIRTKARGRRSSPDSADGVPSDGSSPHQRRRITSPTPPPDGSAFSPSPVVSEDADADNDGEDFASAIGQLSLNEDLQVRYHGRASGLHILGHTDRVDKRNEGGIWRFPGAGVWPPTHTANSGDGLAIAEADARANFPPLDVQQEMLELYFTYVHPALPLMHEAQFWRDFRSQPESGKRNAFQHHISTLLLLSMFAIAARYRTIPDDRPPSQNESMWDAGSDYFESAKRILNQIYALSRPSTCQALLLLSYREVGLGAMAQAWLYVGMAVRMAQDLGIHRSAERWARTGAELFTPSERQIRSRIWFACVIMDKYVSTYIGRPLSIFERDFDTPYPTENPDEEVTPWKPHATLCPCSRPGSTSVPPSSGYTPVSTHLISCFNASAQLSSILSKVIETMYAVQPTPAHPPPPSLARIRRAEALLLEHRLDQWYITLPPHLQLTGGDVKPPHVFTLHMQYWCTVLLLHRPFLQRKAHAHHIMPETEAEAEANASSRKAFDMCALAATKISNTVTKHKEHFCLQRGAAFLTYYLFTASIMHVTTLSIYPEDFQASLGLQRCMTALKTMNVIWPSAGRAWDLLHGAKIDMGCAVLPEQADSPTHHEKRKREQESDAVQMLASQQPLGVVPSSPQLATTTTPQPQLDDQHAQLSENPSSLDFSFFALPFVSESGLPGPGGSNFGPSGDYMMFPPTMDLWRGGDNNGQAADTFNRGRSAITGNWGGTFGGDGAAGSELSGLYEMPMVPDTDNGINGSW